ncbi:tyrosine-protein phosphatase [uncultured Croceitalea sp.]|uniref:tyrosine-protein phosphatase n=1 Tax=uncultured Croceitalea sp. TaxID=1798908 RepID=UPI00374E3259
MFTFFSKKEYLVDHLNGFVDMHNHILPGIDDGAKNVEESIELIKGFSEFGVDRFICTPHIMHNYYDNTPKTIKKAFKKLDKALKANQLENIKVKYAAEHMIDDNFEHLLQNDRILLLNSNCLLIEMSYLQASINLDVSIKKITQRQIYPVLAHPERYIYLHKNINIYKKIKNQGILFQLNMLSLTDYYGKEIQQIAFKLLENNMYDFIASDVHNMKHLKYLKEHLILDKKRLDNTLKLINRTILSML